MKSIQFIQSCALCLFLLCGALPIDASSDCKDYITNRALQIVFDKPSFEITEKERKFSDQYWENPLRYDPLQALFRSMNPASRSLNLPPPVPLVSKIHAYYTNKVNSWIERGLLLPKDRIDLGYNILPVEFQNSELKWSDQDFEYIHYDQEVPEGYFLYDGVVSTAVWLEGIGSKGIMTLSPHGMDSVINSFVLAGEVFATNHHHNYWIQHDYTHVGIILGEHVGDDYPEIMRALRRGLNQPHYWRNPEHQELTDGLDFRVFLALESMEILSKDAHPALLKAKLIQSGGPSLKTFSSLFKRYSSESIDSLRSKAQKWDLILDDLRLPVGSLVGNRLSINRFSHEKALFYHVSFWLTLHLELKEMLKHIKTCSAKDWAKALAMLELSHQLDRGLGGPSDWIQFFLQPTHKQQKNAVKWMRQSQWIEHLPPNQSANWGLLLTRP